MLHVVVAVVAAVVVAVVGATSVSGAQCIGVVAQAAGYMESSHASADGHHSATRSVGTTASSHAAKIGQVGAHRQLAKTVDARVQRRQSGLGQITILGAYFGDSFEIKIKIKKVEVMCTYWEHIMKVSKKNVPKNYVYTVVLNKKYEYIVDALSFTIIKGGIYFLSLIFI